MTRLSYKSLFLIVVFLLIPIVFLLRLQTAPKSIFAAWWNDSWTYRQAITITVSSSASDIIDLDTNLSIGTSSLVASGKLQSDCDDLRFTDISGNILPYFIDSGCNTSTTKIWVRANLVPKNTTTYTVYVYYGNPSASSASSSSIFNLYNGLVGYWNFNENTGTSAANLAIGGSSATFGSGTSVPSWSTGQYGVGLSFSNNSYASVPHHTNQTTLPMTISLWAKSNTINQGDWHALVSKYVGASRNGWDFDTSSGNYYFYYYGDASHKIACNHPSEYGCSLGAGSTAWSHLVAVVSTNGAALYRDGSLVTNASWSSTPMDSTQTANLWIGRITGAASTSFNGSIDDVRIYNRALSSDEITKLYNTPGSITNISSTISKPTVSFATEETGGGPIAWWKFDEGVGTTAFDTSGKNNHGIFGSGTSAPTWTDESQCITGKCLKFDGSNDYILQTTPNNIPSGQTARTISAWIKPTNTNPGGVIVAQNGSVGTSQSFILMLGTVSSTTYLFSDGENSNNNITITGSEIPSINSWHHISFTFNGNNTWVYYLDGVQKKTGTFATPINTVTSNIEIGRRGDSPNIGSYFPGFIDDVKIYPYARSASQIKADYTSGLAGQSSSNSSTNMGEQSAKGLSDGLVAYYKFDEGVGTTSTDSSGNSNLATFSGSTLPTWSNGKYGIGLSYNGINNYINCGSSSTITSLGAFTFSAWIKTSSTTSNAVFSFSNSSTVISIKNVTNRSLLQLGANNYQYFTNSTDLADGNWHHILFTIDGNGQYDIDNSRMYVDGQIQTSGTLVNNGPQSSKTSCQIAKYATSYFNGLIDEVRIYNRALNPTEVKDLYNYAPGPIGYWKFEEGVGTIAKDISGNNNNGIFGSSPADPSWTIGRIGKSLSFSTDDYLNITDNDLLSFGNSSVDSPLTISFWAKPTSLNPTTGNWLINKRDNSINDEWQMAFWQGRLGFTLFDGSNSNTISFGTTNSYPIDQWHYITGVYQGGSSANNLKIYVNGIQQVGNTGMLGTYTAMHNGTSPVKVGVRGWQNADFFNGLIDEVKIYNYARTQSQILEDMNAGSGSKKPIVHYKFDEGQGTLVNNSGIGGTINGTFGSGSSSPTWSEGKFNKALSFDGSDIVSTSSNFSSFSSEFTISTWVKPASSQIAYANIFGNHAANYTGLVCQQNNTTANQYYCAYGNGATWIISSNFNLVPDSWQHLIYTKNSLGIKIYVNGLAVGGTDSTAPISASSTNIRIGQGYASGGRHFNGLIDEFKIYNYALSSDEVKQDYNQDSTTKIGQSSQTIGATTTNLEYCIPGDTSTCSAPIAEWKFEEGTGTTAFDSSGNSNHATLAGTTLPTWTTGKIGKGLNFNGVNAYLDAGTNPLVMSNTWTIEAWVKPTDKANSILAGWQNNTTPPYIALQHSTTGQPLIYMGPSNYRYFPASAWTKLKDGNWHHVVFTMPGASLGDITNSHMYIDGVDQVAGTTYNPANQSSKVRFFIGQGYTFFGGLMDQARYYNYVRTPAQIAYDYNKGEPVGWWKLDECQGSTAYDSSGIGNTGSISIGAGGSQTSVGTCTTSGAWFNGVSGKNNSSLNFDGTDDTISINGSNTSLQITGDITISSWIKTNYSATYQVVIDDLGGSPYTSWCQWLDTSGKVVWYDGGNWRTTQAAVNNGQWHHVVSVVSNNNLKFYIDGIQDPSTYSNVSARVATSDNKRIGTRADGTSYPFNGQLDDVRIYNYALTSTQVKTLYNGGALNFR